MEQFLQYFILIPLVGYLLSLLPSNKQEGAIFKITNLTVALHLLCLLGMTLEWLIQGRPAVFQKLLTLYEANGSDFSIDLFFDGKTSVYAIVAGIITFLITTFSRFYIHREKGYKRFFNNVLFFYLGLNVILFAGNFETLFIGWEIIGITSFFLIAFYRERYLPVKNALKVISVYRLADIFLLLGIWLSHHYFKASITFLELSNLQEQQTAIIDGASFQLLIPFMFLIVAAVKSAQFPFSSWLPRAMEGPTTSSAIFYGSLSVHMGVFLLMRTWPYWQHNIVFSSIVILVGLITSIIATFIARVQSTVKTQIAYSSIAQIGLMFIEVALGWHELALIHFACNAFLRTYQLLVSPSVLSYTIHDQFFHFIPPQHNIKNNFFGKIQMTVYMLSIKEFNLDSFMYRWLWMPMKKLGNMVSFFSSKIVLALLAIIYAAGLYFVYHKSLVPVSIAGYLPVVFAAIGLLIIMRAFTIRGEASHAWTLVLLNQLFTTLAIAFNEEFTFEQVHLYISGILISALIGYMCLWRLKKAGEKTDLNRFHGHSYEHPRLTILFLLASLGVAGFPITPTFIGEDLILGHIHENQFILTAMIALGLILDGLAIFRIYARLFLGPHEKGYHEVAYRSS